MYNIPHYNEKELPVLLDFMRKHPFATVIGCSNNREPVATQVPLLISQEGEALVLTGHLMRKTDHHKAFLENPNVLCLFTGPHTYVSATWYQNTQQASTWNYMSVHAKGTMQFLDDAVLEEILQNTSLYFENGDQDSSTVYKNLPPAYTSRMLHAIVGFKIVVTGLESVFKLSQNRDAESYRNIITQLSAGDADARAISQEMQKRETALFVTGS